MNGLLGECVVYGEGDGGEGVGVFVFCTFVEEGVGYALYPEHSMRAFWKFEGIKVIKTPVQSPRANAFRGSYIGKCKR